MNNQEQGFADPVTSYGDRRPINTDPREQPPWQPMPAPIMARPPRGGRSPWTWLGVSVLILVVIFGGLATASVLLTHQITATKTFTVGDEPKLVLTANAGNVHIVSGPANQISVVAHERVFVENNDAIPVHYNLSDNNTLTVSVDERVTFGLFNFNGGIDLDVTVPGQTALNVQTSSGDITSNGISGQMTLTTSSGSITTDGGSGPITLSTSSGDIHASNLSGQMRLTTSSGAIEVSNVSTSGNSTFQTSSGDISFSGSLAPTGTYAFRASSGSVDLTLPNDAAFQVQATTDSGSFDSAFSGVNVVNGGSGAVANGTVGSGPPFALITIKTSSGDIHLRKA